MKLNLKVKEKIIDGINDSLVLKEAEIARLKTRIGLMERSTILNEIVNNNNNNSELANEEQKPIS